MGNKISKLVIHCTDSPDHVQVTLADVKRWHTDPVEKGGRGWSDIGYHYLVLRDGTIEVGRTHNGDSVLEGKEIGAHVKGHNSDSLAICWVGRDRPTYDQRQAMWELVLELMDKHQLTRNHVFGHRELAPESGKTCPNISMDQFREELKVHEPKWREER